MDAGNGSYIKKVAKDITAQLKLRKIISYGDTKSCQMTTQVSWHIYSAAMQALALSDGLKKCD